MKAIFRRTLVLCIATAAQTVQALDFEDLESRIDYAYFTEDGNALVSLIQTLRGSIEKEERTAASYYLLAFAHYRHSLLLGGKGKTETPDHSSDCVNDLDKAIDLDSKFADAYALQAACYGYLAGRRSWQRVMDTPLATWRMDKAFKLEPSNPRAFLLDGLREYEGHKLMGGDKSRALERFRRAIELFESQRHNPPDMPGWGLADAYAWLGRGLMENGETLAARNAFERALIVAPEFTAVRRELRQLIEKSR